jgi:hypothetical protein
MVLDAAADGIPEIRAAAVMVQFLQPQDVCGCWSQKMKQRIEDLLRERRIKRIGRRLVAATKRDEKFKLYELFRAEISNRSPQQIARMLRRSKEVLRREGVL